ncbi:hypothetical protein [Microbacterium sp. EST19A]|uniref:hypothetical protein n=1 Tax=Microbacterium sp. EST19A TaxID=2862681 RepID=UPI001CBA6CB8|nr:hypothetical protein [Microbacterium sp. EST19A]
MDTFVLWCAAIGAWLLVAGPLYQGALELAEVAARYADHLSQPVAPERHPSEVSPWWWLLPPVAVVLIWRSARRERAAYVESVSPTTREAITTFSSHAQGWLLVAAGAFLIALKETWHLIHALHGGVTIYVIVVVVAGLLAFGNTVARMRARAA